MGRLWLALGSGSRVLCYVTTGNRGRRLCGHLWLAEAYSPTAKWMRIRIDRAFARIGDPEHCKRCFIEDWK